MRNMHSLFWIGVGMLLLPAGAAAQQPLRWQPTLDSAKRLAGQTDRLVLIHFWADWCRSCQTADRGLFSQPAVAAAVEANYVPVKINADYFPATCNQYGVTTLPSDVIVTPQGQQIDRVEGLVPPADYVARLSRVAAAMKRRSMQTYAQAPVGPPPAAAGQAYPPQTGAGDQAPSMPRASDPRQADYYDRQRQSRMSPAQLAYGNQPADNAGAGQPGQPREAVAQQSMAAAARAGAAPGAPSSQRPPINPPLGLDGYCPVQLDDDMRANLKRWTLGDRRWGAIHRGRTYLFAGPEQQRRFLADPDRYAPVFGGNDVVIAVEQGQTVPGRREHGVRFHSQIYGSNVYLFANEVSLEKFSKNPDHYARQILQAMQAGPRRPSSAVY